MRQAHPHAAAAWYREPWPWILAGLPAAAVVAGIATLVIAVRNADGLVAEDYYKQGLAINRVLEREARAAALGLVAAVSFDAGLVRVRMSGDVAPPPTLTLRFVHPTRADADRIVPLARTPDGGYQAAAPDLAAGYWRVQLEDGERTWRLSSNRWNAGEALTLRSGDVRPAGPGS